MTYNVMDYEKIIKQMIAYKAISKEVVEKYCPELKESDGERIRKEIISAVNIYCSEYSRGTKVREDMLAWIEKQCEQKPQLTISKQRLSVLKMEFWTGLETFNASEMTLSDAYNKGIEDVLEELDIEKV